MFAFWLLSESISGFLSYRSYCLTLERKKKAFRLFLNCQASFADLPGSCRQTEGAGLWRGWGGGCFFLVVLKGWELGLGYNNHRCPVSSPLPSENFVACTVHCGHLHRTPCFIELHFFVLFRYCIFINIETRYPSAKRLRVTEGECDMSIF